MSDSKQLQPSATPTYILRGHGAPIHALHLFNQNLRLISADADGWILVWDLVTKRPVAAWKAHEGAVLEVRGFKSETATDVYTHGRDHKLRLWTFRVQDENILDKVLPVDRDESSSQNQPWLVHSLPVNALNFCAFGILFIEKSNKTPVEDGQTPQSENPSRSPALIAVPNALDSGAIDIFHLPLERRICTIPSGANTQTGMVMSVKLFISQSGHLYAASAYEDGHVMVFVRQGTFNESDLSNDNTNASWKWDKLYASRLHSQPVLSIDVPPSMDYVLSCSADALLIKHPIPLPAPSDSVLIGRAEESPLKTVNTKHAGQQGLRIRSDGKVFATAGWDCRVRVYSCKTMKELAVLKWHKEGCYAVGFAEISTDQGSVSSTTDTETTSDDQQAARRGDYSLAAVQQQRNQKVQKTHWLAAGSKDGKISLWDIY